MVWPRDFAFSRPWKGESRLACGGHGTDSDQERELMLTAAQPEGAPSGREEPSGARIV